MKLFKRTLLLLALIFVFYFMLINISQTVDIKYFFGDSGILKDVSLIVVIFLSVMSGFFIGIIFLLFEYYDLRKKVKSQKVELDLLKEEVDSHRNIVVKDVLKTDGVNKEINEDINEEL